MVPKKVRAKLLASFRSYLSDEQILNLCKELNSVEGTKPQFRITLDSIISHLDKSEIDADK